MAMFDPFFDDFNKFLIREIRNLRFYGIKLKSSFCLVSEKRQLKSGYPFCVRKARTSGGSGEKTPARPGRGHQTSNRGIKACGSISAFFGCRQVCGECDVRNRWQGQATVHVIIMLIFAAQHKCNRSLRLRAARPSSSNSMTFPQPQRAGISR